MYLLHDDPGGNLDAEATLWNRRRLVRRADEVTIELARRRDNVVEDASRKKENQSINQSIFHYSACGLGAHVALYVGKERKYGREGKREGQVTLERVARQSARVANEWQHRLGVGLGREEAGGADSHEERESFALEAGAGKQEVGHRFWDLAEWQSGEGARWKRFTDGSEYEGGVGAAGELMHRTKHWHLESEQSSSDRRSLEGVRCTLACGMDASPRFQRLALIDEEEGENLRKRCQFVDGAQKDGIWRCRSSSTLKGLSRRSRVQFPVGPLFAFLTSSWIVPPYFPPFKTFSALQGIPMNIFESFGSQEDRETHFLQRRIEALSVPDRGYGCGTELVKGLPVFAFAREMVVHVPRECYLLFKSSKRSKLSPQNTVADTPPFRSTRLCYLGVVWASGGTEVWAFALFFSHLGTIFSTPLAIDATSVDYDEMGLHSSLDTGSTSHASQQPNCSTLTNPTRLPRHTPLRRAARAGAAVDEHGAGAIAGEQWGYGARALRCLESDCVQHWSLVPFKKMLFSQLLHKRDTAGEVLGA
ncbi:hypothetical protein C8R43DRAFT_962831 [Mycena crocata]|nr:hypothetical protein C8R43DRAFT_962831 [Mycena crocata]